MQESLAALASTSSTTSSWESYVTCYLDTRVIINISGEIYETQLETLDRFPGTLLSNKFKREQYYDHKRGEFYFDRNRLAFAGILYFYQSNGRLIRPFEVPEEIFDEEVKFFELPKQSNGDDDCSDSDTNEEENEIQDPLDRSYHRFRRKAMQDESKSANFRMCIWSVLEYPFKSVVGKCLAALDILMICVSLCSICCETMPSYKAILCDVYNKQVCIQTDEIYRLQLYTSTTSHVQEYFSHWTFLSEAIAVLWFVSRFVLRMYACPFAKKRFLLTTTNIFDLLSSVPIFVQLIYSHRYSDSMPITCVSSSSISLVSILRVIRVSRLVYYVRGLRAVIETMRLCSPDLINFVMFNLVGTIFFACLVYSSEEQALTFEEEVENQFQSAPDTFWWALITLTTVGYGDYVPYSNLAKLIGCICLIAGAFTVSLPVPIIAAKFQTVYKKLHGQKVMLR